MKECVCSEKEGELIVVQPVQLNAGPYTEPVIVSWGFSPGRAAEQASISVRVCH